MFGYSPETCLAENRKHKRRLNIKENVKWRNEDFIFTSAVVQGAKDVNTAFLSVYWKQVRIQQEGDWRSLSSRWDEEKLKTMLLIKKENCHEATILTVLKIISLLSLTHLILKVYQPNYNASGILGTWTIIKAICVARQNAYSTNMAAVVSSKSREK